MRPVSESSDDRSVTVDPLDIPAILKGERATDKIVRRQAASPGETDQSIIAEPVELDAAAVSALAALAAEEVPATDPSMAKSPQRGPQGRAGAAEVRPGR